MKLPSPWTSALCHRTGWKSSAQNMLDALCSTQSVKIWRLSNAWRHVSSSSPSSGPTLLFFWLSSDSIVFSPAFSSCSKRAFSTSCCALCRSPWYTWFSLPNWHPLWTNNLSWSPCIEVWCLDNWATLSVTFSLSLLGLKLCWSHSFMPGGIMENVWHVINNCHQAHSLKMFNLYVYFLSHSSIKIVSQKK